MILIIGIALILFGIIQDCVADEYSASWEQAERHHSERMEQKERHHKEKLRQRAEKLKKERNKTMLSTKHKVTRTIARDERGRFVAQETVEEV